MTPARAAILAALPAPGFRPADAAEARLAERLLCNAERRVELNGESVEDAAALIWEVWLDEQP